MQFQNLEGANRTGGGGNWLAVIAVSGHRVAQQIVDQRRHHLPFNWSLVTQDGRM